MWSWVSQPAKKPREPKLATGDEEQVHLLRETLLDEDQSAPSAANGVQRPTNTSWCSQNLSRRFGSARDDLKLLPMPLIILYLLNGLYQSFPMTAYGSLLFEDLKMDPATTTIFYAVTFIPWYCKPLYGWLSDNFPICGLRRRPYIIISELVAMCMYGVTALFIHSVPGIYAVTMLRATANAFSELMLGAILADIVSHSREKAGAVQAVASSARAFSSIIAFSLGIPVYSHNVSPRLIILLTATGPLAAAFTALWLEDYPVMKVRSDQGNRVRATALSRQWTVWKPIVLPLLFLFLYNATPTASSAWFQYTYSLFKDDKACLQYSLLVSSLAKFLACMAYGIGCTQRPIHWVFVTTTVLACLATLPELLLVPPVRDLGLGVCLLNTLETFISSFAGELAFLPLLVLATANCPYGREGLAYSIYLSVINLGDVVSGLLSAPLIKALGIQTDGSGQQHWEHLGALIVICVACQVLVLLFIPLCGINKSIRLLGPQFDADSLPIGRKIGQKSKGTSNGAILKC